MRLAVSHLILAALLACSCSGIVNAEIVPLSRFSMVRVKGEADGDSYNHLSHTEELASWSKVELGFVGGVGDDFATGSAGQGTVFDFDGADLKRVALETAPDSAQRGGGARATSEFVLELEVRNRPPGFLLFGQMDALAPNDAAVRFRDLSRDTTLYSHFSADSSDPLSYIDATGLLKPGRYEFAAIANVNFAPPGGVVTSLEATLQFSQPSAVPLPSAALPGFGMLSAVVASVSWARGRKAMGKEPRRV